MSLQIDFGIAIQRLRKQRCMSQERMTEMHKGDIIDLRANIYSSFDSSGNACQGYLYELEIGIAMLIKDLIQRVEHNDELLKVLKRF